MRSTPVRVLKLYSPRTLKRALYVALRGRGEATAPAEIMSILPSMSTVATTAASQATVARETKSGSPLHEDWVAVWIGAAIILLVIAGVRPPVPRFGWGTPADLSAMVFTSANMSWWLLLGVLLLIPAAIGAHLMRTPWSLSSAVSPRSTVWRCSRKFLRASRVRVRWALSTSSLRW